LGFQYLIPVKKNVQLSENLTKYQIKHFNGEKKIPGSFQGCRLLVPSFIVAVEVESIFQFWISLFCGVEVVLSLESRRAYLFRLELFTKHL
jgi:hypothetical protein